MSKEEAECKPEAGDGEDELDEWYALQGSDRMGSDQIIVIHSELLIPCVGAVGINESSVQAVPVTRLSCPLESEPTLTLRAEEQLRMNDCWYEKRDWRACKTEVSEEL